MKMNFKIKKKHHFKIKKDNFTSKIIKILITIKKIIINSYFVIINSSLSKNNLNQMNGMLMIMNKIKIILLLNGVQMNLKKLFYKENLMLIIFNRMQMTKNKLLCGVKMIIKKINYKNNKHKYKYKYNKNNNKEIGALKTKKLIIMKH